MTKQPRYRFAGYTEAWEEKKFSHYLTESRVKGSSGDIAKKLTVKLWSKGIVPKLELYSGSSATQYYIRSKGQFMYGKLDFLNQAFGIIPEELDGYESTLDSPAFDISESLNSSFLLEYVARKEFYEYQGIIANGSRKAKRIHVDTFLDMPINVPSLPEQTAIGSYFQDIDQLISSQQRKLEVLKEQKKTYLKLLFPAKGQTKPALRFAGYEDDWKEVKLGEVLTERNIQMVPSDKVPLVSFTVENGVTPKTERYNREFLVREDSKKYKYTRYNDIVYNPANLKFGAIARNKYGEAVFSPIYVTFEANYSNILPEFIEGILTSKDFIQRALKFQEGTVYERMAVKADDFRRLSITVPSLPEQEAIGSFFQDLDKAIAKQEEKVNQLKESKQTLLRKMFI